MITRLAPQQPQHVQSLISWSFFQQTMLSQPKRLHFSQSPVFFLERVLPKTSPKKCLEQSQQKSRSDLPQPDLESYSVTMRAVGEAAARRHGSDGSDGSAEAEAEGWRQALQLLEELRERRLSATTRMLGGKHPGKPAEAELLASWMLYTDGLNIWNGTLIHKWRFLLDASSKIDVSMGKSWKIRENHLGMRDFPIAIV